MKKLFKELLDMEEVRGVMLLSPEGELIFREFQNPVVENPENKASWGLFIHSLKGAKEVEILFQNAKVYVRETALGHLFVMADVLTPMAILRLYSALVLPNLRRTGTSRLSRRLRRIHP